MKKAGAAKWMAGMLIASGVSILMYIVSGKTNLEVILAIGMGVVLGRIFLRCGF